MSLHPAAEAVLRSMPWVSIARAPMRERGRYYNRYRAILVRHGIRGPAYSAVIVHEGVHAERGDEPLPDPVLEARRERQVEREAARRLIDIRDLAEAAAAFPDDPHRVADELGVDFDALATRMSALHPAERHYLRRRLQVEEESP